jgi:hypothetical protein
MSAADMELGPCQVEFNSIDLGGTKGVTVTWKTPAADLLRDQFGTEFYDKVITGQSCTVKMGLVDITMHNLAVALNQTARAGSGKNAIAGTNLVGTKMSTLAHVLTLKKYVAGVPSTDEDDWLTFKKAFALSDSLALSFDANTQRVIELEFLAMQDTQGLLYIIGDTTIAS